MKSIGRCRSCCFKRREIAGRRRQHHLCLERAADLLVLPQRLDLGEHTFAQRQEPIPLLDQRRIRERIQLGDGGEQRHVHRFFASAWQKAPELVGGERQDRRQQAGQTVCHQIQSRLRRAPLARARGERIQAVLRDVVVERAEIDRGELRQRLRNRAVVVFVVGAEDLLRHLGVARQNVAIDLLHLR